MNNLKKIGLTALGTALVSSSAVAGSLDVTGTAGIIFPIYQQVCPSDDT